jgi:ABC-type multidrug transport system fused ATPase/permease subunit
MPQANRLSGTVRSNLDPFKQFTDPELREALQRVHLVRSPESRDELALEPTPGDPATENSNINIFADLSSTISSGGLNLSQGQRQLLCLARAILAHSKIMILDEATSAVDMETDALIQRSIREEFEGSTLLVIAHRLSTVADFDRILVMSDGRAVEFGAPKELWARKGAFYHMVAESGDREGLEALILGEGAVEVED